VGSLDDDVCDRESDEVPGAKRVKDLQPIAQQPARLDSIGFRIWGMWFRVSG